MASQPIEPVPSADGGDAAPTNGSTVDALPRASSTESAALGGADSIGWDDGAIC